MVQFPLGMEFERTLLAGSVQDHILTVDAVKQDVIDYDFNDPNSGFNVTWEAGSGE